MVEKIFTGISLNMIWQTKPSEREIQMLFSTMKMPADLKYLLSKLIFAENVL